MAGSGSKARMAAQPPNPGGEVGPCKGPSGEEQPAARQRRKDELQDVRPTRTLPEEATHASRQQAPWSRPCRPGMPPACCPRCPQTCYGAKGAGRMAAHPSVHRLIQHSSGQQQGHGGHIVCQRQLEQDSVAILGRVAGQLRGDGGPSNGECKLRPEDARGMFEQLV